MITTSPLDTAENVRLNTSASKDGVNNDHAKPKTMIKKTYLESYPGTTHNTTGTKPLSTHINVIKRNLSKKTSMSLKTTKPLQTESESLQVYSRVVIDSKCQAAMLNRYLKYSLRGSLIDETIRRILSDNSYEVYLDNFSHHCNITIIMIHFIIYI